MSKFMIGELRGIKTRQAGEYTFKYLVLEGQNLQSEDIQLNQDLDKPEHIAALERLKGKLITVPFYIRKFSAKAGTAFSLNYDGNRLPAEYKGA